MIRKIERTSATKSSAEMDNRAVTSIVKVKINEDNEIEYIEENMNDETDDEENEERAQQIDEESILVQRSDGVMTIKTKSQTIVEHVCGKCSKSYDTISALKRHLNLCRNVPKSEAVTYKEKDGTELMALSEKFKKDIVDQKKCFCCMENLITAHSGHIQCNFCPKSFKSHVNLERHLFTVHSPSTKFACTNCNATCPSQEILNLHLQSHNQTNKPFSCKNCGKDFTRKYHLDRHHQFTGCGDLPRLQLPCEVCKRVFTRYDNLREHLRGHMGQVTRKRDYKCPYCEKAFYGSSLLNIHLRTHTGERPFPCDLCPKAFPSNGALRKHRRMHTGERPYTCQICKKCFSARETLNRHMKIHTGERPHVCTICNKSYIQAAQLKSHMFYHTAENGFNCDYCRQVFSHKKRLETHIITMHTNQSAFKCPVCNREFRREVDFKLHQKNGHQVLMRKAVNNKNKKEKEQHNCPICNKEFIRFYSMQKHIKDIHNSVYVDRSITEEPSEKTKPSAPPTITTNINDDGIDTFIIKIEDGTLQKETEIHTEILMEMDTDMNNNELRDSIKQLLKTLMDEEMLIEFGWPTALVDDVLESVIKQCGQQPVDKRTCADVGTVLRENTKILFTSVIDNESIKEMLNNYTIDEVILHVLKLPS